MKNGAIIYSTIVIPVKTYIGRQKHHSGKKLINTFLIWQTSPVIYLKENAKNL